MKKVNRLPFLSVVALPFGIALGVSLPARAQSAGPVPFDSTESALVGTYACDGGATVTISPVDASTTDIAGSNDATASNLSADACGLPLYAIASADDASDASDTASLDDGGGSSTLSQVSLLGGIVTYTSKSESDSCTADADSDVTCSGSTSFQGLTFGGQAIRGSFTQPTTFNATSLQVSLPGYCTGLAIFTGQLIVADYRIQQSGDFTDLESSPIHLTGTLSCVGLPLSSVAVDLKDDWDTDGEGWKEIKFEFPAMDTL